jgi:transposase
MTDYTAQTSAPATLETTHRNHAPSRDRQADGIGAIVLHDAEDAKEKLFDAKVAEEKVIAIIAIGRKKPALMCALVDSVCTDDTEKAIAKRYSVHQSTLSYWGRKVGLPRRRRGRRSLLQPTSEHKRILDLVHNYGISEAARRAGISKQRISQIVCRWAPELKGRRRARKIVARPRPKRRSPRNIIVSFRISTDEWQRLLATEPTLEEAGLSGFGKARAIVLEHLAPADGDGNGLRAATPAPATGTQNHDGANVYNQAAA